MIQKEAERSKRYRDKKRSEKQEEQISDRLYYISLKLINLVGIGATDLLSDKEIKWDTKVRRKHAEYLSGTMGIEEAAKEIEDRGFYVQKPTDESRKIRTLKSPLGSHFNDEALLREFIEEKLDIHFKEMKIPKKSKISHKGRILNVRRWN